MRRSLSFVLVALFGFVQIDCGNELSTTPTPSPASVMVTGTATLDETSLDSGKSTFSFPVGYIAKLKLNNVKDAILGCSLRINQGKPEPLYFGVAKEISSTVPGIYNYKIECRGIRGSTAEVGFVINFFKG